MDDHYLEEIARGQQERTVKDISAKNQLLRVKTLSKTMWRNPGIRTEVMMRETPHITLAKRVKSWR